MIQKQRITFAILLPLLVALVACGRGRAVEWADDFSDPKSGWKAESDSSAQVEYAEGTLRVLIKLPNSLAWASAQREFADFHLTVDATQAAGPDDNEYGVLVRMKDPDHFYCFSVSGDGYYMVSKYDAGQWITLSGEDWLPSDAIQKGAATNRLEVIGRGAKMKFLVNGVELIEVKDSSYSRGDVGLYAGSFFEPDVEIRFDNLTVAAP